MKGNVKLTMTQSTSNAAEALSAVAFARLLEQFHLSDVPTIAVAVSGGPDSMALAFCAQRWAAAHCKELYAFIVDHQLRPESTAEARSVKQALGNLGIKAEILTWHHETIATAIHKQARAARYDLLLSACKSYGIKHLLLAHQREDQAETILMRLAKGSGLHGLSGMAAASTVSGIKLLRPLLDIPKAVLVATCEAASLSCVTDQSNTSPKYARGRLRRVLPLLAEEGLTVERLLDLGNRAYEAHQALDYYTQEFLRRAVAVTPAGQLRIERTPFEQAPKAIGLAVLAHCLQQINRHAYEPERRALATVYSDVIAQHSIRRTLHGCLISGRSHVIECIREPAHLTEQQAIKSGTTICWDRRWQVTLDAAFMPEAEDLTVAPLGLQPQSVLEKLAPNLRKFIPQGRLRAGLPALWQGSKLLLIPALPTLPWKSQFQAKIIMPEDRM